MANTDNLTNALMIVLFINLFLFLGQYAVLQINPNAPVNYDIKGSLLCNFESSNCQDLNYTLKADVEGDLPSGTTGISPTTGNLFTDIFTSVKSWFADATGLNYVYSILKAPYNLLNAIGLPEMLVFGIGSLWYGITLFLLIAFMWGR